VCVVQLELNLRPLRNAVANNTGYDWALKSGTHRHTLISDVAMEVVSHRPGPHKSTWRTQARGLWRDGLKLRGLWRGLRFIAFLFPSAGVPDLVFSASLPF